MAAALDAVRGGDADGAVVPIENSVEGAVTVTLDELAAKAKSYSLTPEERGAWEELGEIGFLLGED